MSEGSTQLDRFLETDPRDVGCADAIEMLHVYCDLTVSGHEPRDRFPGIAAHLDACGPCREDFAGLVAALRNQIT